MSVTTETGLLEQILGGTSPVLSRLRAARPAVFAGVQRSYESLVDPDDDLPALLRTTVALRVAAIAGSPVLLAWFTELADEAGLDDPTISALTDPAAEVPGAAVELASLSARSPGAVDAAACERFLDAGHGHRELVALMQLTAFVSYLARLVQGLAAVRDREEAA